ncbi:hypothetical protein B0H13DRAFT_2532542 [Mycena leptocephala]|nr:hypothetical protein B0H13DRAFT_2532542 [Mycena leptocephala]
MLVIDKVFCACDAKIFWLFTYEKTAYSEFCALFLKFLLDFAGWIPRYRRLYHLTISGSQACLLYPIFGCHVTLPPACWTHSERHDNTPSLHRWLLCREWEHSRHRAGRTCGQRRERKSPSQAQMPHQLQSLSPPPTALLDAPQPKTKMTPLNTHLSPLVASSVGESRTRTPSPRLSSGIRSEASPLDTNGLASPVVPPSVLDIATPPPPPQAPRHPSPSFTSNCVPRPVPPMSKPFHVSYQSSSPSFATNRNPRARVPSPQPHLLSPASAGAPSHEEGEIFPSPRHHYVRARFTPHAAHLSLRDIVIVWARVCAPDAAVLARAGPPHC